MHLKKKWSYFRSLINTILHKFVVKQQQETFLDKKKKKRKNNLCVFGKINYCDNSHSKFGSLKLNKSSTWLFEESFQNDKDNHFSQVHCN